MPAQRLEDNAQRQEGPGLYRLQAASRLCVAQPRRACLGPSVPGTCVPTGTAGFTGTPCQVWRARQGPGLPLLDVRHPDQFRSG